MNIYQVNNSTYTLIATVPGSVIEWSGLSVSSAGLIVRGVVNGVESDDSNMVMP